MSDTKGVPISSVWFSQNAPDWSFVRRQSGVGDRASSEFYFLFQNDYPDDGIIWFPETMECRFFRFKLEQVPEHIRRHIESLGLPLQELKKLSLPTPRTIHLDLSTFRERE